MRLFIAREAVDPHLSKAGAMIDPDAPIGAKLKGLTGLGAHMAGWFPRLIAGKGQLPSYSQYGSLAGHMRFVERASRKLGRTLFYAMTRFGPKLEKRQSVLFRLVDVGAELFAMAAAIVYARTLQQSDPEVKDAAALADTFCRSARRRIRRHFADVFSNDDVSDYRTAQNALAGQYMWLERNTMMD
jgi:hypothetical protein